jgi:hypothetical protein
MTDAATKKDRDLDLEPMIYELAHMAAVVRFYVSECSGISVDDRLVTTVSYIANMAEGVAEAYKAGAR